MRPGVRRLFALASLGSLGVLATPTFFSLLNADVEDLARAFLQRYASSSAMETSPASN
jgi:hypothetical protein